MRVLVSSALVFMDVRMRFIDIAVDVSMLMMLVMHVQMIVFQGFMFVNVLMPFRQVNPQSNCHQNAGDKKGDRWMVAEKENGDPGADKRR